MNKSIAAIALGNRTKVALIVIAVIVSPLLRQSGHQTAEQSKG